MAKVDFRGLIPGKRYKILIQPNTIYGKVTEIPTIDFIVPEAPSRARNHRLSISKLKPRKTTGPKTVRFKIWKYKISQASDGKKYVLIITGNGSFKENKVKTGDKVTLTFPQTVSNWANYNVTNVNVKNTSNTPKNRIRYLSPNQSAQPTSWITYSDDDSSVGNARILKVKSTQEVRIPRIALRIPKEIYQNLMWNDTVRDFVHIIYRQGSSKANLSGNRKYLVDDSAVNQSTPKASSGNWLIDNYTDGHPPIFRIDIKDKQFYEFSFVIIRYTRKTTSDSWTANWLEQNTPFAKRISQPARWKS